MRRITSVVARQGYTKRTHHDQLDIDTDDSTRSFRPDEEEEQNTTQAEQTQQHFPSPLETPLLI